MHILCRLSIAALSMGAVAAVAHAGTPKFPLPAPWSKHGAEGEAQCGIQTNDIRIMQWGIGGAKDVFGQGYAKTRLGFMFIKTGWPPIGQSIDINTPKVKITMGMMEGRAASSKVNADAQIVQVSNTVYFAAFSDAKAADHLKTVMQAGQVTVTLPNNFRGYSPAVVTTGAKNGEQAYRWYRKYCDNWNV